MKLLKSLLFLSILSFALISCDKKEEEAESCKAGTDLSRPEDNIVCSELPILCTEGDNKYWKDSDENTYANTEDGIKDLTKAICTGVEARNNFV